MPRITNAQGKIWLAIKSRLDQWSETDMMYSDTIYNPSGSRAFIIIANTGVDSGVDQAIGYDCGDEMRGILQLSAMVPVGWSYAQHLGLAGRMADFVYPQRMEYEDAVVVTYARPLVYSTPRLDGGHNRIDLQVQWRCFA